MLQCPSDDFYELVKVSAFHKYAYFYCRTNIFWFTDQNVPKSLPMYNAQGSIGSLGYWLSRLEYVECVACKKPLLEKSYLGIIILI